MDNKLRLTKFKHKLTKILFWLYSIRGGFGWYRRIKINYTIRKIKKVIKQIDNYLNYA